MPSGSGEGIPGTVVGTPGPGVTPAHLEGMQRLADELGEPVVIFGSRQTGVSQHTGKPFQPDTDLDCGVIGGAETVSRAVKLEDLAIAIPDVEHGMMLRLDSEADALARGHLVVALSEENCSSCRGC